MIKVLIELNDVVLLSECKRWLTRHSAKNCVFLAKNLQDAVNMMQLQPVELFLTELALNPAKPNGLETIAAFASHYPLLKMGILIPLSFAKGTQQRLQELSSFYAINAPKTLKDFIHIIQLLEVIHFQSKMIGNMQIADFFVLIEMRKKTCLLEIKTEDKTQKGVVFFNEGILFDAAQTHLKGELAFVDILRWLQVKITFKQLEDLDMTPFRQQIQKSLRELIAIASKNPEAMTADIAPITLENMPVKTIAVLTEAFTTAVIKKTTATQSPVESNLGIRVENSPHLEPLPSSDTTIVKIKTAEQTIDFQLLPVKMKPLAFATHLNTSKLNAVLHPLQTMEDYLTSAIFDMSANIFVKHSRSTHDIETIAQDTSSLIDCTLTALNHIGLGKCDFIQLNCKNSIFETSWIVENQCIVSTLLKPGAKNTGLAKVYLTKVCGEIREQLKERVA